MKGPTDPDREAARTPLRSGAAGSAQASDSGRNTLAGLLMTTGILCAFTGATVYLYADALHGPGLDDEEMAQFWSEHLVLWTWQRGLWVAAVALATSGVAAFAHRLRTPAASGMAALYSIGGAAGFVTFMNSAMAHTPRWWRDHGSIPSWDPAVQAVEAALWESWEISSYVATLGFGLVLLRRWGLRYPGGWAAIVLALYGYFGIGVPAGVFIALIPLAVAAFRRDEVRSDDAGP